MLNKITGHEVDRRLLLKGAAAGGLGIAGATMLAGCAPGAAGPLTFGARTVDESPTQQLQALVAAYTAKTGNEVAYNATESNAFQNNLSQYLQGTPDDCFQWMAGYRMQFFADQGLLEDISDVWDDIGDQYPESYKIASTGLDGKQYFVPQGWYPWGLHFRKSMMAEIGMKPEDIYNWDDFMSALGELKGQGLIGLASADKGGWEAMGTFDILNMRLNGYQFHIDLLNGKEQWTDAKVVEVFNYMGQLAPYMNKNVLDISWDGMRDLLLQKKCGAMMMGSWFANDFKAKSQEDYDDLWIVPFPEINPEHGIDSIDAPLDGISVAANGNNVEGGADLAGFLGSKEGIDAAVAAGDTNIYISSDFDTSTYDAFNKQKLAVLGAAKNIGFFLDRDTRGDFAGPVVGPAIQSFLKNPKDLTKILDSTQAQWDALPAL